MSRIAEVNPSTATGRPKLLLDLTQEQLGKTPNLYRSMANSPAALEGYLAFRGVLVNGVLSANMRERIALLTAAMNDCEYCVSAHTFRGAKAGITEGELCSTQKSHSEDPKIDAALHFVDALIQRRGLINDNEFSRVKAQGWSDEEIGEMVAHVALNVFSNYFNHVAQPELDFPVTPVLRSLS